MNADVDTILHQYEIAARTAIDFAAPNVVRQTLSRQDHPWYNDDINYARKLRRNNEKRGGRRVWRHTGKSSFSIGLQLIYFKAVLSNGDSKTYFCLINTLFKIGERTNTWNALLGVCFLLFWIVREATDCWIVDEDIVHNNSDVNARSSVQLFQLDQTNYVELYIIDTTIDQCPILISFSVKHWTLLDMAFYKIGSKVITII